MGSNQENDEESQIKETLMAQRELRWTAVDAKSITLADPLNILSTTKIERSSSSRTVGVEEVTVNRAKLVSLKPKRTVLEGTTNVVASTQKATIELSCDQFTRSEMKQVLSDLYRNALLAIDSGLLDGFLPENDVPFAIDAPLVVVAP